MGVVVLIGFVATIQRELLGKRESVEQSTTLSC
jgi:hypothetical protein